MMSNSPRGEAQTYPKLQDELYDWSLNKVAAGSNLIMVSDDDACVAWGVPVAGKIGLEGMAATTRVPKFVESVRGLRIVDLSCGYGHACFVVLPDPSAPADSTFPSRYPPYPDIPNTEPRGKTENASKKRKEATPAKGAANSKKGRK